MLIGEDRINNAFNTWLQKYDFDARVRGLENDFYWGCDSDTISYCFVHTERFVSEFTEVCVGLGLKYDLDIFWLSFLHELGHSLTYHFVDDEEIEKAENAEGLDYYYCQREIIATEWAVDFVNEHSDLVVELIEMVRPAIIDFFEKNEIEGI